MPTVGAPMPPTHTTRASSGSSSGERTVTGPHCRIACRARSWPMYGFPPPPVPRIPAPMATESRTFSVANHISQHTASGWNGSRVPVFICQCEEHPLVPSSSRDVAISMRLNTRRRTAVATATRLPRYPRNDKVGTHRAGMAGEPAAVYWRRFLVSTTTLRHQRNEHDATAAGAAPTPLLWLGDRRLLQPFRRSLSNRPNP